MKSIAIIMGVMSALVGTGAALEFAYFAPDTRQFLAGLLATPAGILGLGGAGLLWRRGVQAKRFVAAAAACLLLATAAATALDVMGPPATLAGLLGGGPPIIWAWKQRHVAAEHHENNGREQR